MNEQVECKCGRMVLALEGKPAKKHHPGPDHPAFQGMSRRKRKGSWCPEVPEDLKLPEPPPPPKPKTIKVKNKYAKKKEEPHAERTSPENLEASPGPSCRAVPEDADLHGGGSPGGP